MMKWLDEYCFGVVFVFGLICGVLMGMPMGQRVATERMEKEAVFRQAGFYGKDGDTLKFFWGPKWKEEPRDE